MSALDPHLTVRAAIVYLACVTTAAAWMWKRPTKRLAVGALIASIWSFLALSVLHVAAGQMAWWTYDAQGGLFLGFPIDLWVAWALLWGAAYQLVFDRQPVWVAASAAFAIDIVLMPFCAPVIHLGSPWLVGEAVAVVMVFVPGHLLGRWTARDTYLPGRATLQMVGFSILLLFFFPAVAIEATGAWPSSAWTDLRRASTSELAAIVQIVAILALPGLSGVQEFVTRGGGTPVPFDAPKRLVMSGVYRYVRNPMQLSALLLLAMLGLMLDNRWLLGAAVMAHLYSVGLAGWDEDADLGERFGSSWRAYRAAVPRWLPRRRPYVAADAPPARLFVAEQCGMCQQVGGWFAARGASGLEILAAESHPTPLTRITYDPGDGTGLESGVAAIARALEHLHVAWAFIGLGLRLPGILQVAQLIVDASGGEPRILAGRGPVFPSAGSDTGSDTGSDPVCRAARAR